MEEGRKFCHTSGVTDTAFMFLYSAGTLTHCTGNTQTLRLKCHVAEYLGSTDLGLSLTHCSCGTVLNIQNFTTDKAAVLIRLDHNLSLLTPPTLN